MSTSAMYQLTQHHLWWPRADYKTEIEQEFRELPINIISVCAHTHRMIHKFQQAPRKPSEEVMLETLRQYKGDSWVRRTLGL